jgi:RNA polymerase sigma-54 factor
MLKIATTMIHLQQDFFNHQKGTLKPLCLKDIAVDTGLSESTVSRILNEKYILTPKGTMLLKELLSTAIISQTSDNDQSSKDIQHRLKELISQEKVNKPYSDQEIVMLLKKDGVSIARRTIAKYRMVLGFGSALERKNLYQWSQNTGNQSKTGT